jgi:glutamate-1-semialdehyde 2,1-aminomutase
MMTIFFGQKGPVVDFKTALESNTELYARFFRHMLENGVYIAPSQFEAGFVSLAHGSDEIEETLRAAELAFRSLNKT